MSKINKILLISFTSVALLLIFVTAVLPSIVRSQAVTAIETKTGRTARIDSVSINPFTLTVTIRGCAIDAKDGGRFISIGALRASLGVASIYRRALILSELSIEAPTLTFARLAANSYSFDDITERLKSAPQKESESETHFSINTISVTNGSLDFDDQAVEGGRKHTIRALKIALPFISNIPYLVEKYTEPHISAVVNGAPLRFDGKVKPLSKSLETSIHINLKQLSLPEYIVYLPVKPAADFVSGELSADCDVTYRVSADKTPELAIKGEAGLEKVVVNLRGGKPLLRVPSLQVKASVLNVYARKYLFDAVTVEGLELFASRSASGVWMYDQLLPLSLEGKKAEPAAVAPSKKVPPATLVQVKNFTFSTGTLHFDDAQPTGGFKTTVSQIDATAQNFSTEVNSSADYDLSLVMDNEATFSADGSFSLSPLTVTASSELSGVKVQRAWPYLSPFLTAPINGTVALSAELAYSRELGLVLDGGGVKIDRFSTRYGEGDGFSLARFEARDVQYRQKENALEAGAILFSQGDLSLTRQADGRNSIMTLFKSSQAKQAKPPLSMAAAKQQPAPPEFSYRIKNIQIERFNTAYTDKTVTDKPHFTLKNSSLSLSNLNGPKFTPAVLRFSSTFNKETPLALNGVITPVPFRYKGSLSIGRLPLRDFEAYFPTNLNVFILSGSAETAMNVDIAVKDGKTVGTFKGSSGIRAFHAVDTMDEEDLLKWESLQFDDIQGTLEPFSLALRQIALNDVYSRIIIRPDGTLNLQNLVKKEEKKPDAGVAAVSVPAPQSATPPAITPTSPADAPKKQITVGAVTVQDGTIEFTDKHLLQQFDTTFYNLGGRISGLSSDDSKLADVDLRGNLENLSPLQITGQINPLRGDLFVDLKISFRDIELSPITPYTSRFLGYTVEKGKLYLDLKYLINKKLLTSENKIFVDQFTFGEKVESDKATNLPVKLGLALLKDSKGEIHLDVPVTGHTDDPQFNIWKLAFQVIKNVLVKAVTSPFALLSSMMGSGDDFSAIQFKYGTSVLQPREEQKLNSLAKALLDRPALKVEFKGYVDREKDTEEYRRELLDGKLRNEKFLAITKAGTRKEGETVEQMTILPEEEDTYLAAVYKKEKFPKPRNVFGLVKDLPPEEMKKLIITNTVVGEAELQNLAHDRVKSIVTYMVKKGGVPSERMFQKSDDVFKKPDDDAAIKSRVELNAIAQ